MKYQYLVENATGSSRNNRLKFAGNGNFMQHKFKSQTRNSCFEQICGDVRNWMGINQNHALHQSSFCVALFFSTKEILSLEKS